MIQKVREAHIRSTSCNTSAHLSYVHSGAEVAALNSATNRLQRFSCDVVLCTLPLGVLKETVRLMAEDGDLGVGGEDAPVPTSVSLAASKRGAQAATTGKRPASPSPSPTPDGGGGGQSAAKRACTVADSGASASASTSSASASASSNPCVTSGAAAAAAAAPSNQFIIGPLVVSSPSKRSMRKALKSRIENAPQFFPPLPPWKVDIINKMGFGSLNKVNFVARNYDLK